MILQLPFRRRYNRRATEGSVNVGQTQATVQANGFSRNSAGEVRHDSARAGGSETSGRGTQVLAEARLYRRSSNRAGAAAARTSVAQQGSERRTTHDGRSGQALQSREKGVKEGLWIRLVMLNQCETCSAHPQQHADSKWTVPSPARLPVEGKVR